MIAMATVLNYNNTLKSINLDRPILFTRQVSQGKLDYMKGPYVNNEMQSCKTVCIYRPVFEVW